MVEFLVRRPVAVLMTFFALVALGLSSLGLIPVSMLPDVDIPEITLRVSVPEKSVVEIEQNYLKPIRRQMLQMGHLNDIESLAGNGQGLVRLKFNYGTDINYAFVEVNERIDGLLPSMPGDFERPRIIKASATDIPVFYLTVALKEVGTDQRQNHFMELSEFCEQVIKKRFEQLPEVAMVDISGMQYPEIQISVDQDQLNALGLNYQVIQKTLEENNFSLGNIRVRNGLYEFNVKYSTVLKNRRDIENLSIKVGERIFTLGELATISVVPRSGKGMFVDGNGEAIIMAVIKKSDARMDNLKKQTSEMIGLMEKDYPRLRFEITRNQTELLDYSISNLQSSLLIGAFLAFMIMFLFLKDLKSPTLIAISIPVSLVVSLLFFYLFDISVNIISLSGLILGVGMMVDNSIIVIDNIAQYYESKKTGVLKACVKGANEVIRPLISSVLTTCAVFVPLIFLSGISGALFYDQAMAVTIGLFASLIVSVTLIPVLYNLFYKSTNHNKVDEKKTLLGRFRVFEHIERGYSKSYDWFFKKRRELVFITIAFLVVGYLAFLFIPKERFPLFEKTEANIVIDWNRNIGADENHRRIRLLLDKLGPSGLQIACQIGEQSFILESGNNLMPSEALLYLKAQSPSHYHEVMHIFTEWININYPEALYEIKPPDNIFEKVFGDNKVPFEVQLWTEGSEGIPSPDLLSEISMAIAKETGMAACRKIPLQECYEITPRFDMIKLYDVSMSELINILKTSLNKLSVFTLQQGQMAVPVVVTGTREDIHTVIRNVRVTTVKKGKIPIDQLVTVNRVAGYKVMTAGKDAAYVPLGYDIQDDQLSDVQEKVTSVLKKYPKVHFRFSGTLYSNRVLFKELMIVLVVAVLLLYFILAAQFESVTQPLIVFIEIPIDIAAALILLWLTGNSINLMSLIGLVVMTGIIINDSILKIDTMNRLYREGYDVLSAIHEGGRRRLKPIIMTSATTILAMVPLLWGNDMGSKLQQPLTFAILGGMTVGTFVSLYFIPLAYYYTRRQKS